MRGSHFPWPTDVSGVGGFALLHEDGGSRLISTAGVHASNRYVVEDACCFTGQVSETCTQVGWLEVDLIEQLPPSTGEDGGAADGGALDAAVARSWHFSAACR